MTEPLLSFSAGRAPDGRRRHALVNLGTLVLCGLLAGLVVAAAMFPAIAASGLAAKAGAESFEALPSELTTTRAPQATEVYAADGKTLISRFWDENRHDVTFAQIAEPMREAIIAAEDHNFYVHKGVDAKGIARAALNNSSGGAQQGASTLTMQFVRMSVTYTAPTHADAVKAGEDTTARKIREARLALQAEKKFSKGEILTRYLNLAPFGHSTYGVYAASQFYFGKQPKDLTIADAALMASLVRSPTYYDPLDPDGKERALGRRDWVIGQMVEIKAITAAEGEAAKKQKLTVRGKRPPNGCTATKPNDWGFFCDYFRRWWLEQEAFGPTAYDRERRLNGGGYRVVTTLDPKAQKSARDNVEQRLKTGDKHALMVAAVEPGSGRVRALATNRVFKLDSSANKPSSNPGKSGQRGTYPNTTNPLLTGGSGYQAGSTFKMFTLVAALEKGYPLDYSINAPQRYPSKYHGASGDAACPGTDQWCPGNSSASLAGMHNAWTGFGKSVNTYFVPLEELAGAANAVNVAKRLGIRFLSQQDLDMANNRAAADGWGSFTLGVSGTTPLDLANAYATLAADGKHCEPIPVQQIKDIDGKQLDVANPRCDQAVDREVARAAVDAARCPVGDQSAFGECHGSTSAAAKAAIGQPIAGKTGTTDSKRTASLVVTTRSMAVAGILADPDWPETTANMSHDIVNPAVYETLADIVRGKQPQDFPRPSEKLAYGEQRSIPDVTCQPVDAAKSTLENQGFRVETNPEPVASACPAGSVARTEPAGRTIDGGLVVIRTSTGVAGTPTAPPPAR
ncbi:transglycosylase domain-containing protein [Phytohabitans sp. ZYX-F-186]|uniref:Transglycosylase domain-containing protein n=1 Tax=Phytohabitans maris TaxID=3071409 RepID=A0ABU0ZLA3_9ACTN|nr:transglycosylase domain-containing protein [Phytohabitans sp. ZYX-F-186]MDQ7907819.1 transglycosylase domain-containing protein [Phytohabitans sp. ZYX-F-186]